MNNFLFDARDSGNAARRNFAPGPPATLGESASSAFEDTSANDTSLAAFGQYYSEYDRYLEGLSKATGKQFRNPYEDAATPDDFAFTSNPDSQRVIGFTPPLRPKTSAQREQELFDELSALREEYPDLQIRSPEQIRQAVAANRAAARERRADVSAREGTAGAIVAGVVTAGTFLADPPVLASMAFGAPFASGLVRGALIDAGIGIASEVPVQAIVQASRRRLGEQTSLSEAAINVLTVGAGGFLFSGLIRGGVKGVKALRQRGVTRRAERDALAWMERQADLEGSNPFRDTPEGRAAHEARISEAQLAAREGRATTFTDEPPVAVRRGPATAAKVAADLPEPLQARGGQIEDAGARISDTLRPIIESDADLQGFIDMVRKPPKPPKDQERISTFLARQGGVQDFQGELKAIGLPKGRPGLLRKDGLPLDEAGLRAFEAGFFSERPTVAQLLEVLADDVNTRPRFRPDQEADVAAHEALTAGIESTRADLTDLGLDLNAPDLPARLREVVSKPRAEAAPVEAGASRTLADAQSEISAANVDVDQAFARAVADDFINDLDRRIFLAVC